MFNIRNFENGKSLGGKVHFFKLPWDNENLNNFPIFCACTFIHIVLLILKLSRMI